jgi:hypothetical protein
MSRVRRLVRVEGRKKAQRGAKKWIDFCGFRAFFAAKALGKISPGGRWIATATRRESAA